MRFLIDAIAVAEPEEGVARKGEGSGNAVPAMFLRHNKEVLENVHEIQYRREAAENWHRKGQREGECGACRVQLKAVQPCNSHNKHRIINGNHVCRQLPITTIL